MAAKYVTFKYQQIVLRDCKQNGQKQNMETWQGFIYHCTAYDLVFICFQIYQTSPYDLVLTSISENVFNTLQYTLYKDHSDEKMWQYKIFLKAGIFQEERYM